MGSRSWLTSPLDTENVGSSPRQTLFSRQFWAKSSFLSLMEETVRMLAGALFPPAADPWELQVEGPLLVPWHLESSAPLERRGEAGKGAIAFPGVVAGPPRTWHLGCPRFLCCSWSPHSACSNSFRRGRLLSRWRADHHVLPSADKGGSPPTVASLSTGICLLNHTLLGCSEA